MDKKSEPEKINEKQEEKSSIENEVKDTGVDHEKLLQESFLCAIKFKKKSGSYQSLLALL